MSDHTWRLRIAVVLVFVAARTAAAQSFDPFEPGASSVEVSGAIQVEAWNKNLTSELLFGGSVTRGHTWIRNLQATFEITALRVTEQRARDALYIGATFGARHRLLRRGRVSPFIEWAVGVSSASARTPARGSYFNWVAQAGGGTMVHLTPAIHGVAAFRWLHLSNGGLFGKDRNPDIEALGGYVGVSFAIAGAAVPKR